MFRPAVLASILLMLVPSLAFGGAAPATETTLRVAVIDSGINAAHPEFRLGQVIAWKDFVNGAPVPYDDHGHGTATASLVAGLNAGTCSASSPKVSYAPGVELIIAKVGDKDGTISNLDAAVRWAVAQGADVISISIGTIVPFPLHSPSIKQARAAGVLVVVSAGNGVGGAGLAPFPSWTASDANNPDALSVGGGSRTGTLTSTTGNTDPDVASWSDDVCVARHTGGYRTIGGTSFSAPLVAGMAAKAIEIARANGQRDDPGHIQDVVMYSARNNAFSPYARDGLGHLMDNEFAVVLERAASPVTTAQMIIEYDAQGGHAPRDRQYRTAVMAFKEAQL